MEIEITNEKENPLFGRKEIQGSLEVPVTPSREEVTNSLAQKFSVKPEQVQVKGIKGKFGSKEFAITVDIYSSIEAKESAEPKKKIKGATPNA